MKRIVPSALVLIAIAVAALVFFQHETPHRARAAEIAPPETLLFLQFPDLRQSVQRWPETALAHLWREPEMQEFLALPLEKMPLLVQARSTLAHLARVAPREAFMAITTFDGLAPRFVAGFAFSGNSAEARAAVAEPWAAWQQAWLAGHASVVNYAGSEIETYTDQAQTVAQSFHAGWYLVANDLDVLKTALDRCDGKVGSGLASTQTFRDSTAQLPAELDAVLFAQLGAVEERLAKILPPTGSPSTASPSEETRRTVAWGTKFEGSQMRDTIFLAGRNAPAVPLTRETLALGEPSTVFQMTMALPEQIAWPAVVTSALGLLTPALGALQAEFADKEVTWANFGAAFGPELGLTLEWPEDADAPAGLLALKVRDSARARQFVEAFTSLQREGPGWKREEAGGVIYYESPLEQKLGTTINLALSEHFAVLGGTSPVVRAALARLDAGAGGIDRAEGQQVREPTAVYANLDLKNLFERSYRIFRPFLAMSLAFSGEAGQYFDAGKLPSASALGRHLGPSVYSQAVTEHGTVVESVGSLTFSQTLAGVLAGAWTSAFPALQQLGKKDAAVTSKTPLPPPVEPAPAREPAEISQKRTDNAETAQDRPSQP
jgi:hypothetical protein